MIAETYEKCGKSYLVVGETRTFFDEEFVTCNGQFYFPDSGATFKRLEQAYQFFKNVKGDTMKKINNVQNDIDSKPEEFENYTRGKDIAEILGQTPPAITYMKKHSPDEYRLLSIAIHAEQLNIGHEDLILYVHMLTNIAGKQVKPIVDKLTSATDIAKYVTNKEMADAINKTPSAISYVKKNIPVEFRLVSLGTHAKMMEIGHEDLIMYNKLRAMLKDGFL